MKRCFMAAFLLSMSVFITPVAASSTTKRSLPEFCELYAHRMEALSDFEPSSSYFIYNLNDETKFISLSAGSLMVDQGDLSVNEASIIIHDFNASDEENVKNVTNFMATASALEWGAMEERLNTLVNPVTESKDLYYNDFAPAFLDVMKDNSFFDGSERLIYSRNYDYYVQYQKYGKDDNERVEVWCIIRAREE